MTRRLMLAASTLMALAGAAGPASATHSPSDQPRHDFVNGAGTLLAPPPLEPVRFHFHARSDANALNPQGRFAFDFGTQKFSGEVNCLHATIDFADIGGVVTRSTGVYPVGTQVSFTVRDNDPLAPDLISSISGLGPLEPLCFRQSPSFPVKGQILVHDAPPAFFS